jgi:general secretion pathway protein N
MQARQKWIVASAALLLLFILSAFPAGLAYRWFAPPQLRLSGIDGSVWRGTAIEGAANDLYLRNLEWSFSPLGLLTGKVAYLARTELAGGHLDARIAVGPGGSVTLSDLAGTLALEAFEESFQLKGFEGRLILDFERLTLADGVPREAVGTIAVQGLLARKLSSAPIGDFRAQFVTGDDGISGVVSDESGVLDVDGTITVGSDRSYSLVGQVAAGPRAPAGLRQQLEYLGSPDENGRREFRIEGQL